MKQILKNTGLTSSLSLLPRITFFNAMTIQASIMQHRYYLISISAIFILSGCSKPGSTTPPPASTPPANPLTFTVIEKSTNKPIAGATVSLQRCSNYDSQFGCVAYSTFATLTTNADGKVKYSGNSSIDRIRVEADNYWLQIQRTPVQDVILTPKTRIEVNVKRENTYASTDILSIGQNKYIGDLKTIGLPMDTTVYIDGYGHAENKIYWYINYLNNGIINTSTGGSSPDFYINGFDTARIQIKY